MINGVAKNFKYVWIVHNNCTKQCVHCFCKPAPLDNIAATEKLFEELKQRNIKAYIYATDQMDKNLDGLYANINRKCLIAGNRTNQELLDQRQDIHNLAFSLHGPDAEIHALLSNKKNFEETLANLRKNNKNFNIAVYCVVHSNNYFLLEEMCQFCYDEGVDFVEFLKLSYGGKAVNIPPDFFMSKEQIADFLKHFHRIKSKFKPMKLSLINNWGPQYSKFRILLLRLFGSLSPKRMCQCGAEHITIKAGTREVFPCRYTVTLPELKMGYFDSEKGLVVTNNWFDDLEKRIGEPCKSCKIFIRCQGGCRADAIGEEKHRTGKINIYAGNTYCPVSMGITKYFDKEDFYSIIRLVKRFFSQVFSKWRVENKKI